MAPLSFSSLHPQPQPHFEVRQGPTPYAITLTITRETTTYTSTITLGTEAGGTLTAAPTNTLTTTTTVASAPVQTLGAAPAKASSGNNGVVIGSVLGAFLGFAVLATLVWKCCFDPRSVVWRPSSRFYDYGSSYGSRSEGSSRSSQSRVRRRGGDGGSYVRRVRRSHRVRRPCRAYMRQEKRGSFDEESDWSWRDQKRRDGTSRMVVRNGMAGWNLWGGGRRKRSPGRRDYVEREEVRVRYMQNIDD